MQDSRLLPSTFISSRRTRPRGMRHSRHSSKLNKCRRLKTKHVASRGLSDSKPANPTVDCLPTQTETQSRKREAAKAARRLTDTETVVTGPTFPSSDVVLEFERTKFYNLRKRPRQEQHNEQHQRQHQQLRKQKRKREEPQTPDQTPSRALRRRITEESLSHHEVKLEQEDHMYMPPTPTSCQASNDTEATKMYISQDPGYSEAVARISRFLADDNPPGPLQWYGHSGANDSSSRLATMFDIVDSIEKPVPCEDGEPLAKLQHCLAKFRYGLHSIQDYLQNWMVHEAEGSIAELERARNQARSANSCITNLHDPLHQLPLPALSRRESGYADDELFCGEHIEDDQDIETRTEARLRRNGVAPAPLTGMAIKNLDGNEMTKLLDIYGIIYSAGLFTPAKKELYMKFIGAGRELMEKVLN